MEENPLLEEYLKEIAVGISRGEIRIVKTSNSGRHCYICLEEIKQDGVVLYQPRAVMGIEEKLIFHMHQECFDREFS